MKASKVLDIIELGVLHEIKARDFYRSIASQLPDNGANLKLGIMADVEEEHRRILSNWYKELSGHDPGVQAPMTLDARRMIETPSKNATLKDVVKIICEAEARAYQFYKEAEEKVEDIDSKSVFQKLAQMEKKHEEFYRAEYQTLAQDASIGFADEEIPWMIEARS